MTLSLNKITIHWTAGTYVPTEYEKCCYHFLIKGNGEVVQGFNAPEANIDCTDNHYSRHTGGGNTGNIGVAICAMANFRNKNDIGNFPITEKQFESCCKQVAQLCIKYGIKISPLTVFTHYEFGKRHPNTESANKPDISFLPFAPDIAAESCGDFIRTKIEEYYTLLTGDNN